MPLRKTAMDARRLHGGCAFPWTIADGEEYKHANWPTIGTWVGRDVLASCFSKWNDDEVLG